MIHKILFSFFLSFSPTVFSQQIKVVKFSELQKIMNDPSEAIQVINFWATWCVPCVKELPLFETFREQHGNAQVMLISLDLDLNSDSDRVVRFVKKRGIKSKVYILDQPDPNKWINKIDATWSGAIPATLIRNRKKGTQKFIEGALEKGALEKIIKAL